MKGAAQAVFRFEPGRVGHRAAQGEKMGEQKAPVRRIRPAVGKAHALRMPLDADQGKIGVDNGLRYAVGSVLDDSQSFSRLRYALMMGAVDREAFSVKGMEEASFLGSRGMNLIFSNIFMLPSGGKILDDAASEENIDQLHALADAEDGAAFFQKGP